MERTQYPGGKPICVVVPPLIRKYSVSADDERTVSRRLEETVTKRIPPLRLKDRSASLKVREVYEPGGYPGFFLSLVWQGISPLDGVCLSAKALYKDGAWVCEAWSE